MIYIKIKNIISKLKNGKIDSKFIIQYINFRDYIAITVILIFTVFLLFLNNDKNNY